MNTDDDRAQPDASGPSTTTLVALGLLPLIGIVALVWYISRTGGGLSELTRFRPPVEKLHINRITLPEPGTIRVHVVNEGPDPVQISQVLVDEAYWRFEKKHDGPLRPLTSTVITIPYHWVRGDAHEITLMTEVGGTFSREIPVALRDPQFTGSTILQFGLVGLYVGILPVLLGVLWYPLITRIPAGLYHYVLALTMGLLAYLAVSTWLEAIEFAEDLPSFWQGIPLVALVTLFVFMGLVFLGSFQSTAGSDGADTSPLWIAYLVALGIGLHNMGEGLAIGVSYAAGEASLGRFLMIGFILHNLTEGVGIVAPIAREKPALHHFAWLILLAGGPAVLGTLLGGYAFRPLFAVVFLAIGVGAILQVIWEVGKLLRSETTRAGRASPVSGEVFLGFFTGALVMFLTGMLT